MIRRLSVLLMGVFYLVAGVNHFINPDFYTPLVPAYLPKPELLHLLAGIAELLLGIGVILTNTRKKAATGVMVLLLLLTPAHIHFLQIGSCIPEGLCVPVWVAVLRLFLIHPLLVYWAFSVYRQTNNGQ